MPREAEMILKTQTPLEGRLILIRQTVALSCHTHRRQDDMLAGGGLPQTSLPRKWQEPQRRSPQPCALARWHVGPGRPLSPWAQHSSREKQQAGRTLAARSPGSSVLG